MAGRIRTIKPELLEDEKTASLDDLAWRLFVSLFLLADDYGNFRANESLICGHVFWAHRSVTAERVNSAIDDLEACGLIEIYEVRGQRYGHVAGWEKHQKVDRAGKPRVPGPDGIDVFAMHRRTQTYFIQADGPSEPIKIGKSTRPELRLRQIQNGYPRPLRIVAVLDGDRESEMHARFAHYRKTGEWFEPCQELVDLIASICNGEGIPPRDTLATGLATPSRQVSRLTSDLRPPTSDLFVLASASGPQPKHGAPMEQAAACSETAPLSPPDGPRTNRGTSDDSAEPRGDGARVGAQQGEKKKNATQCPSSDASGDEVKAWLGKWKIGGDEAEIAHFLDHHRSKGNSFKDWTAAWRTWQRNGVRFGRAPSHAPVPTAPPKKPVEVAQVGLWMENLRNAKAGEHIT